MKRPIFLACIAAGVVLSVSARPARAQDKNAPVTYEADDTQYDREQGIVTLTGHVEVYQNDRTLRADKIVYNRNTGVAAATGHVVLQDADGQVTFADYAELTQEMKDGVLKGMRAQLAQNGKLAANGARRIDAQLNELSRAIYTTCNLCAQDPTHAPLWDIRAREAIQDVANKRIEYRDAIIDVFGIPVMYTPYLTHPDPSEKRATGLLVPSFGSGSKHLGAFLSVPYYIVLDGQSDVTLTGIITQKADQELGFAYRRRFNDGRVTINGSISDENLKANGHIFAHGDFAMNDEFRWGFDFNRASNAAYIRDFRIAPNVPVLTSSVYLEGFGQGAYSRSDIRLYQSMNATAISSRLPYVLPRTQYNFVGEQDPWGGRFAFDSEAFNLIRNSGTRTQQVSANFDWSRPFNGAFGDLWKFDAHVDSTATNANGLNLLPNYATVSSANSTQAMPTVSLEMRWPFQRSAGEWGTQVLEPILKGFLSPKSPSYANGRIPNEDALVTEFTDATLFSTNRFQGNDRLEGGPRASLGLHGRWTFPEGGVVDGLVGQSFRTEKDLAFNQYSGLQGTRSDYVARASYTPSPNFDLTTRGRFDARTFNVNFADVTATAGNDLLSVNAGYLYSNTNQFIFYDNPPANFVNAPRDEVSLGANTKYGVWKFSASARRDLRLSRFVSIDAGATYEDECFIFDVRYYRRYVSILSDGGDSGLLFTVTLKTVGEFGFHGS
jgi:LPS-assembly protein